VSLFTTDTAANTPLILISAFLKFHLQKCISEVLLGLSTLYNLCQTVTEIIQAVTMNRNKN